MYVCLCLCVCVCVCMSDNDDDGKKRTVVAFERHSRWKTLAKGGKRGKKLSL